MQWRATSRRFVSGRGGAREGSGVRNLRLVVAGRRSRRSRSPVRHAPSSPQMGCRKLCRKGIWQWLSPHLPMGRMAVLLMLRPSRRQSLLRLGNGARANVVWLACHARCAIVALATRSLEDRCVSRPSRSSSNANRPANRNPTLLNRRSGESWTLTSHKVSKISVIWKKRPPPVVTTAPDVQAAALKSASGCRECRKLTARCAWAAAWKMARLSLARTDSQDCR